MTEEEKPTPIDRWSMWFNRAMQSAGLCLGLYEAVVPSKAQISVFIFAAALMLGNLGLRLMVKGFAQFLQGVVDDSDK